VPDFLRPTRWPGLFEVAPGKWPAVEPLLRAGKLYLQDPSTRIPVDLLAPVPGESVLDLCAAPGGKSLALADAMSRPAPAPVPDAGTTGPDPASAAEPAPAAAPAAAPSAGQLVAVDLPGPRIERLKENLARITGLEVALVQADALGDLVPILREHRLPEKYPAVLLDVPCSNTGVMRHRIDVKWRLEPGDFKKHPRQQLSLLHAAARLVASGGRLVYSTCSLDTEENAQVVRAFLAGKAGGPFTLERSVISTPWADGHDGGAAFLLRKA
jgi:16S rRNA (cytosine967-C5)-methyltransferase